MKKEFIYVKDRELLSDLDVDLDEDTFVFVYGNKRINLSNTTLVVHDVVEWLRKNFGDDVQFKTTVEEGGIVIELYDRSIAGFFRLVHCSGL